MTGSSVLYDAPGPRARRRNIAYTVGFILLMALAAWWVLDTLGDKGELERDKWSPFVTDSRVWTTYLLPGLLSTLQAAALAMVIALPLGAVLGIGRLSEHRWIRVPSGAVVEFFRAIPVLMLMLFASQFYVEYTDIARDFRPLFAVVTGLVLYNAAVLAEVVRAGIQALPRGQTDAALAIGMRKSQLMRLVLLPQAVTAMLPAIVSQLVVIVKDTALGGAMLNFSELLREGRLVSSNYANTIASFLVVALLFITVNFLLTGFAGWLEARVRRGKRGSGAVVTVDPTDQREVTRTGEPRIRAEEPGASPGNPGDPD